MNLQNIIKTALFCLLVSTSTEAMARPDLTPEELAKAQEIASQMNPPVDINTLLDEAERLGVECDNISRKIKLKSCILKVDTEQSKERQAKLDEDNARLDKEAIQMVNALSEEAERKLNQ